MTSLSIIGLTQPIGKLADLTSAQLLAFCARVSSTANQMNHATGPKLIRSLIRRKEWSPLDMINVLVEVETTRDIGRQVLRHHSLRFQEFSQRYAAVTADFVIREARLQHPTDRQSSIEIDPDSELAQWFAQEQREHAADTRRRYDAALARGIAKECARVYLAEGMTPTSMYINGNLRSWVHYGLLRSDPATQKEHREIGTLVMQALAEHYPDLIEAVTVE